MGDWQASSGLTPYPRAQNLEIYFLFYLFTFPEKLDLQREAETKSSIIQFTLLVAATAGTNPIWNQELLPGFPHRCRIPRCWAFLYCPLRLQTSHSPPLLLLERQIYRMEERQRGRSSVRCFTAQGLQLPELCWSKTRSPELLLGLPWWCKVPRLWAILNCFPRQQAGSWMISRATGFRTGTHMGSLHVQGEDFSC